ncbi:MAG: SMP-30/gluconolactonase/LRE family protein [Myxococcales bacterium]|nr:SMP-30/gluconolactonase/LRE family protein [Myxococcales bacterium]
MWSRSTLVFLFAACSGSAPGGPDAAVDSGGEVDAPSGNPLTDVGAVTRVAPAMTFQFLEGPQWRQGEADWLFTDIPANQIYRYAPGGAVTSFRTPSGNANGLAQERGGTILAAEHGGRRISRISGTTVTAVAERFEGKLFHSPNDVVTAADGTIYFTDPPYGLNGRPAELTFNGVFRVAGGAVTAEHRGAVDTRPNGIAISPDGKKVYVAFTHNGEVLGFPVLAGGALGPPARAALTAGNADGMAVDAAGNLFVTSQNGVEVFAPDGTKWGEIKTPGAPGPKPTNCAFGGADRRTLLITTPQALFQVTLRYGGLPTR